MPKPEGRSRPPIDTELLAAFIDGRLDRARRAEVIERLAEDEDAYELYDEVVRVREELDATEGSTGPFPEPTPAPAEPESGAEPPEAGRVVPFRRRFGRLATRWLPVAAALAVALLAGWWLLRPSATPSSTELLAAFDPGTVGKEVARSAPEQFETPFRGQTEERAAQFKLGARAFDLALAAEAGEPESTREWAGEMRTLLGEVFLGSHLAEHYRSIAEQLDSGTAPRELRTEIVEAEAVLEQELDLPEAPLFAFGRWLEAVRFAAVHGDRAFLGSRAARRSLERFLASEPSEAVAHQLQIVSGELAGDAEVADLDTLAKAITEIQRHCADGKPCLDAASP